MAKAQVIHQGGPQKLGDAVSIGCLDVETPQGTVHFHDAPGLTSAVLRRPGTPTSIALLAYRNNPAVGLMAQLTPAIAREFAASLERLADEVEAEQGGRH